MPAKKSSWQNDSCWSYTTQSWVHLRRVANVERSHMGKIERGERLPNLVLIIKLATALKMAPVTLVDKTIKLLPDGFRLES